MAVGGTGVDVGGTGVPVGGTAVAVAGTGVDVGGTGVAVDDTGVPVGGRGVPVDEAGTGVDVGGTDVAVAAGSGAWVVAWATGRESTGAFPGLPHAATSKTARMAVSPKRYLPRKWYPIIPKLP